ncbi:MAG TPA: transketolase C-terminal domain-containing protein, partial [Thermoleophilaceae bacterium]|nr:transketolase C-terminal domain-containing protein [Thermoleophilaceae bacterium]
ATRTGSVLVVDEDYRRGGLSGEIAAILAEAGIRFSFARVTTDETLPYSRALEDRALPSVERILAAARRLTQGSGTGARGRSDVAFPPGPLKEGWWSRALETHRSP